MRRLVDIVVAGTALVILGPAIGIIALAVRLDSPGPAIFRQTRVGLDGRLFTMLKFRTMQHGAGGPLITMGGTTDIRVTRLGRMIRRTRLDELPQLVNVLRGDMTLIGPRPEVPEYVDLYRPDQREVLSVRPGLTGPGQIEYTSRFEPLLEGAADPNRVYIEQILGPKLDLDLAYVRNRSLAADIRIVVQTLRVVLPSRADSSAD